MTWAAISTWRMSFEGLKKASKLLQEQQSAGDAVEQLINDVESFPDYHSVGYGGLPNEEGVVQMDAGYMDGDTFAQGSVAAIENVKNAVSVARKLSERKTNSFLVGQGATKFAMQNGFTMTNMLTKKAKTQWEDRMQAEKQENLVPYDGHDTVGAVMLDQKGSMVAATSTSGLFMKENGRIGDSPLSGSGFYVDSSIGGAAATGLGEDIMKGCLSYEIVNKMGEGKSPQQACDESLYPFINKLKEKYGSVGAISLIALDQNGNFGVATNVQFAFCVAGTNQTPTIFVAEPEDNKTHIFPFTQKWLKKFEAETHIPLD